MPPITYGYVRTLPAVDFDEALARTTEALKAEGFGVITEIDVQATFAKKLGIDFRRYVILGACNPVLARRGLETDPQLGLLLPCNVVVQELDEGVVVSVIDPKAMLGVVHSSTMQELAEEVDERVKRVLAAV